MVQGTDDTSQESVYSNMNRPSSGNHDPPKLPFYSSILILGEPLEFHITFLTHVLLN